MVHDRGKRLGESGRGRRGLLGGERAQGLGSLSSLLLLLWCLLMWCLWLLLLLLLLLSVLGHLCGVEVVIRGSRDSVVCRLCGSRGGRWVQRWEGLLLAELVLVLWVDGVGRLLRRDLAGDTSGEKHYDCTVVIILKWKKDKKTCKSFLQQVYKNETKQRTEGPKKESRQEGTEGITEKTEETRSREKSGRSISLYTTKSARQKMPGQKQFFVLKAILAGPKVEKGTRSQ